jgi:Protein of unknown function (DUF2934)
MPKPIKESSQPKGESQSAERHPTREEIELRAYAIYVESGCVSGSDVENWLQAERELREKCATKGGAAKAKAV